MRNRINELIAKMHHLPATLLLVAVVLAFSACEKETFETETPQDGISILSEDGKSETVDAKNFIPNIEPDNAIELELPEVGEENKDGVQLRSSTPHAFKCEYDVHVDYHKWHFYYFKKSALPDPLKYKIKVVMTPTWQDADLYCHGYDSYNHNWRTIRHDAKRGYGVSESLTFRLTDLHSFEDRIYINVYGYQHASFKICFYYYPVDCEEYPSADQAIPRIYDPVCGCDYNTYENYYAAQAAGITSWTHGKCHAPAPCHYYFNEHFDHYYHGYIGPQSHDWRTWSPHGEGTREDCEIISSTDHHRGKILKIYDDNPHEGGHGHQNIIRKLGNLTHGKYELKWDMYVKKGHRAFYSIQHDEYPGEYACSVVFWYNGTAKLIIGKYDYHRKIQDQHYVKEKKYHHGRWFKVKHIVDLDHGRIDLYIDGHHFHSWDFPRGYPSHHLNQLGGVHFKGFDRSKFFIDNLELNCLY